MTGYEHMCISKYARNMELKQHKNWYSHIPKSVNEHEDITVLWNQGE
jgi:hypothetical protein